MPESVLTQVQSVLLLDNSQSDATQLCETLKSLPFWQLDTTIHLSGEGIFPTAGRSFDLLLVADDYAHSKLGQIIEIAKFYQPLARIVLLSTAQGGAHSPQEFVDAARAGVSYCLLKEDLSVKALLDMLQEVFNDGKPTADSAPASTTPLSTAGNNEAPAADTVAVARNEMPSPATDNIADEITLGIIKFSVAGEDFIYSSINSAAAESEQLSRRELIGQRLTTHALNFENFNLANALRQVNADSAPQSHRVMSLRDDATANWRDIVIQRLPKGDLLVEIQNVTERVQHDASQRYDEQIWRHIVASLPDMSVLLDENGMVIQLVSGEWQQLNIDSSTLVGQPITNILLPNDRDKCQQSIQKALNTSKTQTAIYAVDALESQFHLQVKIALLHAEVDAPRQVIWVAREITEAHVEVDTHISDQELLNEMLQRAPLMTAITNVEGLYEHVNPAFAQQLQQASDAIIGKTDTELFSEKVALTLQNLDQKVLAEGIAQECDIALPGDNGEQNFRVIKIPLNGMSMLTQNIFTFAIPLAPLVEQEKAAADGQHQQLPVAQSESIDDLVGDIARDFNDVLVNLTEHTRIALYDSSGEPASEITTYLRAVMNSSQRARDLVLQMMTYQNTGDIKHESSTVDLTLFMSGIVDLLRSTIGQHLQISSDLQQNLLVQEVDSLRIQNTLIQLFRVAQESFDASGHLSVCMRVLTEQDHVCAYCYGKMRGEFVAISMHNSMHTNADAMNKITADLPQDETLLSQIKRIHELLKPYSGHIMLQGEAGEEQSWYVFLAVDPEAERALKISPTSETEQIADSAR